MRRTYLAPVSCLTALIFIFAAAYFFNKDEKVFEPMSERSYSVRFELTGTGEEALPIIEADPLSCLNELSTIEALRETVRELLKTDEAAVIEWLSRVRLAPDDYFEFVYVLSEHLGEQGNLFESIAKLEALKGKNYNILHERVVSALLSEYSSMESPSAVLDYLFDPENANIAEISDTEAGMEMVVGADEPQEVIAMIETRPDGELRTNLRLGAYKQWLSKDESSLYAHLNQRELDSDLDSLISSMVNRRKYTHPSQVITWAEVIEDPMLRQDALFQAGTAWAKVDKAGYQNWVSELKDLSLRVEIEGGVAADNAKGRSSQDAVLEQNL